MRSHILVAPKPLILFTTTQGFNDLRLHSTSMAETEAPRIRFENRLQAGAFIGLFLGFSLGSRLGAHAALTNLSALSASCA